MSKESKKLLTELFETKRKIELLEAAYRKVCSCNERISGVHTSLRTNDYRQTYKTCDYHTYRAMHHAVL